MLGGILRSVMNPVNLLQIGMGPAGWASLAMRQIGAQIGMNIIQQLGQRLGLPQPMIDMAQAAFAQNAGMPGIARQEIRQAVSGLAGAFNLSPRNAVDLERAANDDVTRSVNDLISSSSEDEDARGGGWLMAIARTLGRQLDKQANKLEGMSAKLDDNKPSDTAKFSAEAQKFSMAFSAANTVIKTIGEALGQTARKQ